jgi:hypothetical protein
MKNPPSYQTDSRHTEKVKYYLIVIKQEYVIVV